MKKATAIACAWNLLFLAGCGVFAIGLWLAWKPLGLMAVGLFVMVLGYGGGFEQLTKGGRRR